MKDRFFSLLTQLLRIFQIVIVHGCQINRDVLKQVAQQSSHTCTLHFCYHLTQLWEQSSVECPLAET